MKETQAIKIISALADGIDPFTGEVLPEESPYQEAQSIRALHLALEGLRNMLMEKEQLSNAGSKWSYEEDENLANEFDEGVPIKVIAGRHERSLTAILARLVKLGKLPGTLL